MGGRCHCSAGWPLSSIPVYPVSSGWGAATKNGSQEAERGTAFSPYLVHFKVDVVNVLTPGLKFGKRLDVASNDFPEGSHGFRHQQVNHGLKMSHICVGLGRVLL